MDAEFTDKVTQHYIDHWKNAPKTKVWDAEKINKKVNNFKVLEFSPTNKRNMWTYATCGMSTMEEKTPIELHIFSEKQDRSLIELLTVIAYYHRGHHLGLSHTVNFGRPWQDNSKCEYGLISLPYLDGPSLENLYIPSYDENIKFYWLIPINEDEVAFKKKNGIEALAAKFDETEFNYLNPYRDGVVG